MREKWQRLHYKIPEHEYSISHAQCYVQWCQMKVSLTSQSNVDGLLMQINKSRTEQRKQVFRWILDVTLFLGETGLAFRGDTHLVGDSGNGNFLWILDLIGRYNSIMRDHLTKVKNSRRAHQRLQAHYLSADSQNEFIHCCARQVTNIITHELYLAKYFTIKVDATPDSSHVKQPVFVVWYVHLSAEGKFEVCKWFLKFINGNKKKLERLQLN